MGRLEKIVVLTVLALVFAILFYSLRSDTSGGLDQANASERVGPRGGNGNGAGRRNSPDADAAQRRAAGGANLGAAPGGVMSTSLAPRTPTGSAPEDTGSAPVAPGAPVAGIVAAGNVAAGNVAAGNVAADGIASGAPVTNPSTNPAPTAANTPTPAIAPQPAAHTQYLVSSVGLTATVSDEFMLYTWQAGDSYRTVAEKYYGSPTHAKRLRDANEGRDDAKLAAGERILVSVKPTAAADRIARPSARDAQANAGVDGATYTVGAGDVLGTISKHVYGSASKWRKIYDANRDVIGADPNQLKVGMVLRIPQ